MCQSETMHLAVDISFAHTDYLWGIPGSWQGYQYYGPDFYEDVARIAQRGMFDMVFFGDAAETPEHFDDGFSVPVRKGVRWPKHDMTPMIPLMARVAPKLGFGLTMSTTYHHPFHVARMFASLDHVTQGRMAWNAVTSAYKNEAANYGFEKMMPAAERYARAREHLEVVQKLWASVEPDAIRLDRENGIFADPSKVHFVDHKGEYYNVRGPLPCIPSPQGKPVIIQAGQSDDGLNLAARHADMQFVQRRTAASITDHRTRLDGLLEKHGRQSRDLGVFWAVRTQVGETREDALRKERFYLDSVPGNAGLIELSIWYGIDFTKLDPKMKLADAAEAIRAEQVMWGTFQEILKTEDPDITVEEMGRKMLATRSNHVIGSPKEVADHLEEAHVAGGRNGGIILARSFAAPGMLRDFVELVVPELQRRGLVRKEYPERVTLRGLLDS